MIRSSALALAAACQLVLLGQSSLLWASEADDAAARALFNEGRKLVDSGSYAEGCIKFEQSLKLDPGLGTSFNLADCEERIGRTASAWTRFLDVAAATKLQGQQERERVARARAAALEPRLSRLSLEVGAKVDGLVVERDGMPVDSAAWGMALPIDPGEHVIGAKAPGKEPWSETISVSAGPSTLRVRVPELQSVPQRPPPATPAFPPAKPPASPVQAATGVEQGRPLSPASLVLGTVGAVVLSTGGVFAVAMSSENDQAKSLCPAGLCATQDEKRRHDSLVENAHRDRAVAFVVAGVGVSALVAAAYLYLRPRHVSLQAHSAWYVPRPVPGPLALHLGAEW